MESGRASAKAEDCGREVHYVSLEAVSFRYLTVVSYAGGEKPHYV